MSFVSEKIRPNLKYAEMTGWIVVFILAWQMISTYLVNPIFLPPPSRVADYLATPDMLKAVSETVSVVILAFPLSIGMGFLIAFLVSYSPTLYRSIYPILFSFKAIPSTGVAVLMVVWFGAGFLTKFVVVLYTGFFSVMVNSVGGMTRVKYEYVEMMQSIQASKLTTFRKLLIPNAMPNIFTGLKNACPEVIIGVIVAELFAGNTGIGYNATVAVAMMNLAQQFSTLAWMAILGMVLFGIVVTIERLMHPWYLRKPAA